MHGPGYQSCQLRIRGASSPRRLLCWRPISSLKACADVYCIIYDGGPGMHTHHATRRKLADLSLTTSRIHVFTFVGHHRRPRVVPGAVHSRPVKLVNRSGLILHFVCRNGPHVLRLGWQLGCARRHRPNPSKSQYQPRGGAVVTRRAIALVLSTHTHRVAKPKVGRRLLAVDACLTCRYRDHCFVWTSVECCGEIKGRKGLSSALV